MKKLNLTFNTLLGNQKIQNYTHYLKGLLEKNVKSNVFSRLPQEIYQKKYTLQLHVRSPFVIPKTQFKGNKF